jgi:hypothetical protein
MVALQFCKELIVVICYKLRMFGVEIDGPANVFCDNRGIVKNRGGGSWYFKSWKGRW